MSFYSPSIAKEIKEFVLGHVYSYLEDLGEELPEFLLVGGDTNTVFEKLDKEGGNLDYKHEAINAFQQVMQRFSLVDSYRLKNPDKKEFTWETLNPSIIRERIDIIFVSSSLSDYAVDTGIIPVHKTCSDHGIPYVRIKGYGIPSRGPGLWKLNNQLLKDNDYVDQMNAKIRRWIKEAETDLPENLGSQ